jgi:hypothetical protein
VDVRVDATSPYLRKLLVAYSTLRVERFHLLIDTRRFSVKERMCLRCRFHAVEHGLKARFG